MNPPEAQSDSSPEERYFDPDLPDSSEQCFSVNLQAESSSFISGVNPGHPPEHGQALPAEAERGSFEEEAEQFSAGCADVNASERDWRNLVSAKVQNYKSRKPRKERYPSLQLQFDTGVRWKPDPPAPQPEASARETVYSTTEPFPSPPRVAFHASTEATARVLEFPRPGMLPFNRDELAEPVVDRPRIIEAPELLPPPPALGGILIEPKAEPEPERRPGLDLPAHTASISRRIAAAMIDGSLVAGGLAIFGYMFLRFNASLPPLRTSAALAAGFAALLWSSYQFAFLNWCGKTPGLSLARLRIARFDGSPVARGARKWRVLASLLSGLSLGLGYVWCLVDEDQLCWHDRITRTHLKVTH